MFPGSRQLSQANTFRWRIFVDYLASTTTSTFNESTLEQKLLAFELQWQEEKWGSNEDENWSSTGDLLNILGDVKTKWGDIL